jgi:hypothetical protein
VLIDGIKDRFIRGSDSGKQEDTQQDRQALVSVSSIRVWKTSVRTLEEPVPSQTEERATYSSSAGVVVAPATFEGCHQRQREKSPVNPIANSCPCLVTNIC